jgi:hypothetical protein
MYIIHREVKTVHKSNFGSKNISGTINRSHVIKIFFTQRKTYFKPIEYTSKEYMAAKVLPEK